MNEIAAGVIARLVEMSGSVEGKTVMQKLIYFLQESRVPLGFKYQLYFYGPYSHELAYAVSDFESFGILSIRSGAGNATVYETGPSANIFIEANKSLIEKFESAIRDVLDKFGLKSSSKLELLATIHFISRSLHDKGEAVSKNRVVELTKKEKPKFTEAEINSSYDELVTSGFISNGN